MTTTQTDAYEAVRTDKQELADAIKMLVSLSEDCGRLTTPFFSAYPLCNDVHTKQTYYLSVVLAAINDVSPPLRIGDEVVACRIAVPKFTDRLQRYYIPELKKGSMHRVAHIYYIRSKWYITLEGIGKKYPESEKVAIPFLFRAYDFSRTES